eukprot:COSAG02_NODE_74087_length_163_cov_25.812500_1_plen_52_part_10
MQLHCRALCARIALLADCHSKYTPCLSSARYATRHAILSYIMHEIPSVVSSI